jgi:excinuclease ABC subunit A
LSTWQADVERIEGLPPTLAIEQRAAAANPRSIVATTTEIYDFLRVLFARAGTPHCPTCSRPIQRHTIDQIVDAVFAQPAGTRIMVLAPLVRGRSGNHQPVFRRIQRRVLSGARQRQAVRRRRAGRAAGRQAGQR